MSQNKITLKLFILFFAGVLVGSVFSKITGGKPPVTVNESQICPTVENVDEQNTNKGFDHETFFSVPPKNTGADKEF